MNGDEWVMKRRRRAYDPGEVPIVDGTGKRIPPGVLAQLRLLEGTRRAPTFERPSDRRVTATILAYAAIVVGLLALLGRALT